MRSQIAIVPLWVIERVTDANALRHYMWLAGKYANGKRHCWPGEGRLARELGCSIRTSQRAISSLRDADALIVIRTRRREDGYFGHNEYLLPLDDPRDALTGTTNMAGGSEQGKQGVSAGRDHATDLADGSDQQRSNVSAGQRDHPPYDKFGGSEPYPDEPYPLNHHSEANASDSDARASCPGQADATAEYGAVEGGRGADDLFASWPGLDQEQRESQDPRTPRPENESSTNGGSLGSNVKVKRTRRSSSRAPLPPDQAAAVAAGVAGWVDDYRDGHGGTEPTEHKRGQAAREIRALIVAGNPPDRVLHAARSAGRAGYATVEQQLARMTSTNGASRPGRVSATELPRDDWRRFVQE